MSIAHSVWLGQAAMVHMWRQEVTAENDTSGQDRASLSWLFRGAPLSLSFSETSYCEHEVGVLGIAGLLMMNSHS